MTKTTKTAKTVLVQTSEGNVRVDKILLPRGRATEAAKKIAVRLMGKRAECLHVRLSHEGGRGKFHIYDAVIGIRSKDSSGPGKNIRIEVPKD